jgi:SPP1 family predicted phage head-tail adaptor
MQAGKLNCRVTVQQKTLVQDSSGSWTETWTDLFEVWAEIKPYSGREYQLGGETQSTVNSTVRIRFMKGITSAMRFKHNRNCYDILEIYNVDERNKELLSRCMKYELGK